MDEKDSEITWFSYIKVLLVFVVPLLVLMIGVYLYSLTPQAIEANKEHQKQLDSMSCTDLFNKLINSIPHGYTVGSTSIQLDEYSNELKIKQCIKP
jgi:uncharacterized membrane protein YqhA